VKDAEAMINGFIEAAARHAGPTEALAHLFKINTKEIIDIYRVVEDLESFHKWFRQQDVMDDGNLDMAIWLLIGSDSFFWDFMNEK